MTDTYIMLCLCLAGLIDIWLEKYTGISLVERVEGWIDSVTNYRWKRKAN